MTVVSASIASSAACIVAGGNFPSASEILSAVISRASGKLRPVTRSVSTEPVAMDATHPCALKRASATRPSCTRTDNRIVSPQTGLATSTTAVGSARFPALCGFRKCSRIFSFTAGLSTYRTSFLKLYPAPRNLRRLTSQYLPPVNSSAPTLRREHAGQNKNRLRLLSLFVSIP